MYLSVAFAFLPLIAVPPAASVTLMQAANHTSIARGPLAVTGGALGLCSTPGKALTGFTRDGHCQDFDDDAGSHHICIKMKADFCTVTGQPNWCVEDMPCHEDQSSMCPIGNWCVCQWAFARYIQQAGGCDAIVDLECSATNMAAVIAYEASSDPTHKEALACIKAKCGI